MNKIITLAIFLLPFISESQSLSAKIKRMLRKEVKEMFAEDQKYRVQLNQSGNQDSLWKLQSTADSTNKRKLTEIIKLHGYPSRQRINGSEYSTILVLHLTLDNDFTDLKELFLSELENGNMPPRDYALWFDRCLINQKNETYYGEYGHKSFCDDELEKINSRRIAIGLQKLERGSNCN